MSKCRTLLPRNNRTPLEGALERAQCTGIENMPVPLRDLWQADSCPAELLPWLAWALSVDVWEDAWSDAQKREVIRRSVEIHKHKGTLYAVEQAIAALGIEAELTEWWQDKARIGRGRFHVDIKATDPGIDSGDKQQTLRRFIEHSKRLSALYAVFANDSAGLNVVAHNALLSQLKDRMAPALEVQATSTHIAHIHVNSHLKELGSPEAFICPDTARIWLETSNKRHYYKPSLAMRVVSQDCDVVTDTRTEASGQLYPSQALKLGAHIRSEKLTPAVWQTQSPVVMAFESSNRKMALKPDLAVRVTTAEIAIATDTGREVRAESPVVAATLGLARIENLNVKPHLQLAFQQSVATTNQLYGHHQQRDVLVNTLKIKRQPDVGMLSVNQAVIPHHDNLTVRIASRNVALTGSQRKEVKATLATGGLMPGCGMTIQQQAQTTEVAQQVIIATWAMIGLLHSRQTLEQPQDALAPAPIAVAIIATTYDHSSPVMQNKATLGKLQDAVFFGLIRQL